MNCIAAYSTVAHHNTESDSFTLLKLLALQNEKSQLHTMVGEKKKSRTVFYKCRVEQTFDSFKNVMH